MVVYATYGVGGMEGHVSRDCTMEQKAKSCYRCGREGHIVRYFFFPMPHPLCPFLMTTHAKMPGATGHHSRVIVLIPKTALEAAAAAVLVPALVQNAIVAERSATLHVRAPRRPEAAREAMAEEAEAEEEDTPVSVVEVKRHVTRAVG
ncbi:hypothetical protein BJV78DRAFT_179517 [Lactifluus subvellereus]|nr:hypothetical protein BJV78DRAFT_179517 [Lactifluus subvellereus]